jgi:hypothetical protein
MDRQTELGIIRAAYAKQILAAAGVVNDPRLEAALGTIRREDFLGPGPWPIMRWFRDRDYVTTPDADPVYLYTDDLVGILPERHLNNGQPSLHAHLIHQASPAAGEHVVHIGTGTGYYTCHPGSPHGILRPGYRNRIRTRTRRARQSQFHRLPKRRNHRGRRDFGFVRSSRCHLRQCRLHAAGPKLARSSR